MSKCAACGKGGDGLKACAACKLVKYCNVTCQKAHRPNHKKECTKRAAEIFDEALYVIARRSAEGICPFCRTPAPTSVEGGVEQIKKRVEAGDANAMHNLGHQYFEGDGVPQDSNKALELWRRAAKLGRAASHNNLATCYAQGEVVEKDENKAKYHWERAAMRGSVTARYNLGVFEAQASNTYRAMKHFMIS
ncbi:hypothetical protein ACHAXR_010423 [Thalassiosira sp. AJA248-18]